MSVLLKSKNICKYFGGVKAVNNVDMEVKKGEIFGIIGPNGAGKTTFFNMCSGNLLPTEGEIWFKNEKITGMSPEQIANKGIARTFQNIKLFAYMSVLDNIKIGFHMQQKTNVMDAVFRTKQYKEDEAFATQKGLEIIEKVGLGEYANTMAGNLSYGVQRKVEIARALATNPEIILLDEPAAGMNPSETKQLMAFCKKINEDGPYRCGDRA